jgi:hypothetical protein
VAARLAVPRSLDLGFRRMSGEHYISASLRPVPTAYEAGWPPDTVRTGGGEERNLCLFRK